MTSSSTVETVSNNKTSTEPNYNVAVRKNTESANIQQVQLDIGTGTTSSPVTTANPLPVSIISALVPSAYDYISLSYTGSNLTGVVYKSGGAAGTTVATLAIAYSGSDITSVTRT